MCADQPVVGKVRLYDPLPLPITTMYFGKADVVPKLKRKTVRFETRVSQKDGTTQKRMICHYCDHCLVAEKIRKKDGSVWYHLSDEGYGICRQCLKTIAMQTPGFPIEYYCGRQGKRSARENYLIFRGEFCDNKDGLLAIPCSYGSVRPPTYKILSVDHVMENQNRLEMEDCTPEEAAQINHAHNCQTLCANCHTYKSHLVATKNKAQLMTMLRKQRDKHRILYSEDDIVRWADEMIVNNKSTLGEKSQKRQANNKLMSKEE